ncbi:hypothetical protein ACI2KV_11735 [Micromonospora chokoriensis]
MKTVELNQEALHCLAVAEQVAQATVRDRLATGHPEPLQPLAARSWVPQYAMNLMEVRAAGWLLAANGDERERRQVRIYRAVWSAAEEQGNWQTLEEQPTA